MYQIWRTLQALRCQCKTSWERRLPTPQSVLIRKPRVTCWIWAWERLLLQNLTSKVSWTPVVLMLPWVMTNSSRTCSRFRKKFRNARAGRLLCPLSWLPGLNGRSSIQVSCRQLPPPCYKDDKDTRNVIVKAMQQPKPKKAADIPVANPRNSDPLDLLQDASRDATLELMKERHRKESCSSSTASRSSSACKRHRSSSRSGDETNPKKGRPTPDWEHAVPEEETPPPRQQSLVPAYKFNLNWHQDILEPLRPKWKPAARNAPATAQHKV